MLLQDMVSKAMPYLPLEQQSVSGFSLLTEVLTLALSIDGLVVGFVIVAVCLFVGFFYCQI